MAEFIVHGVVNGQEISQCKKESRVFCEGFYTNYKGIKKICAVLLVIAWHIVILFMKKTIENFYLISEDLVPILE